MTPSDTELFFEFLATEAALLRCALEGWADIHDESAIEAGEPMTPAGPPAFAQVLFNRGWSRLRELEDALGRIEGGDFGACVDCGERISPKRLAATPWVSRCLRCQEAAKNRINRKDDPASLSLGLNRESTEAARFLVTTTFATSRHSCKHRFRYEMKRSRKKGNV